MGRTPIFTRIVREELPGADPEQNRSLRAHEEREDEGAGLRDAQQNRALEAGPGNLSYSRVLLELLTDVF